MNKYDRSVELYRELIQEMCDIDFDAFIKALILVDSGQKSHRISQEKLDIMFDKWFDSTAKTMMHNTLAFK